MKIIEITEIQNNIKKYNSTNTILFVKGLTLRVNSKYKLKSRVPYEKY